MINIIEDSTIKNLEAKQNGSSKKNHNVNPRLNPPGIFLTKRESECFYLLSKGIFTKKIASILGLAPSTVQIYINKIKAKMGLFHKSELTEKAIALVCENLLNGV